MCLDSHVYVVFTKAKNLGWLTPFLHKEISHCYVMWADCDRLLVVDQSVNKTSVFTRDSDSDIIGELVRAKVGDGGKLLGLNTCVSSVKRILGITNPFILTPYQLYRTLKDVSL